MSGIGQAPSEGARNQRRIGDRGQSAACCVPVRPWSSLGSSIPASFLGFFPSRRVRSVRSLQLKFSALVATLLFVASVGLTWMATRHERAALEAEVREARLPPSRRTWPESPRSSCWRGMSSGERLDREDRSSRSTSSRRGAGLVAARLVKRETSDSGEITETIVASLDPQEQDKEGRFSLGERRGAEPDRDRAARRPSGGGSAGRLQRRAGWARPRSSSIWVSWSSPWWRRASGSSRSSPSRSWLLGILGGIGFVALLVGPIRRLHAGVERLAGGDLATRVPPTSRDEVGELTRAFNKMGESLQQKERIQRAFGRYASDYVLNTLLESPEGSELAGVEREVTIVFADIRSFTRLSEGMKAHDVVALLNEIFQLASDRLLARGGTIDKFIGDSVMAYFGAPVPDPDHAMHAVSAAIDIVRGDRRAKPAARRRRPPRRDRHRHPYRDRGGRHHRLGPAHGFHRGGRRRERGPPPGEARPARRDPGLRGRTAAGPGTVHLRFEGERQLSGRVEPVHVYSVDPSPPPARAVGAGEHAEPT